MYASHFRISPTPGVLSPGISPGMGSQSSPPVIDTAAPQQPVRSALEQQIRLTAPSSSTQWAGKLSPSPDAICHA